jgi:hypothetical protein
MESNTKSDGNYYDHYVIIGVKCRSFFDILKLEINFPHSVLIRNKALTNINALLYMKNLVKLSEVLKIIIRLNVSLYGNFVSTFVFCT